MHRLTIPALLLAAALPVGAARAQTADSAAGAVAPGAAPRSAVELRRAGLRYAPVVRTCYEREGLLLDPALRGRLEVSLTVAASGAVDGVSVDTVDVAGAGMREVARCVVDAAARWHLAAGPYATEAIVLAYDLVPPETRRAAIPPAAPLGPLPRSAP